MCMCLCLDISMMCIVSSVCVLCVLCMYVCTVVVKKKFPYRY